MSHVTMIDAGDVPLILGIGIAYDRTKGRVAIYRGKCEVRVRAIRYGKGSSGKCLAMTPLMPSINFQG